MLTAIIITLVAIVIGLSYGCINLMKQVEKAEEECDEYRYILIDLRTKFIDTETMLREIDLRGAFAADDEVGIIFQNIKEMTLELSDEINRAHEIFTEQQ
jgi:hypothetical protein